MLVHLGVSLIFVDGSFLPAMIDDTPACVYSISIYIVLFTCKLCISLPGEVPKGSCIPTTDKKSPDRNSKQALGIWEWGKICENYQRSKMGFLIMRNIPALKQFTALKVPAR